jgi:hypothetical protein
MSSLVTRIYFNAVFGGLGGLLGWMLLGVFFDARATGLDRFLLAGVLIGGSIGFFVVSVEAIRDRSLIRFNRLATYGLLLGALGGALGMLIGEAVNNFLVRLMGADRGDFLKVMGGMGARGLGWMFLGLAVGMSEGIAARSLGKFSYGAVGGTIGGFVGGGLFHLCYRASQSPAEGTGGSGAVWGALGLVILGACIGSLSALVRGVFQPASVKVLRGWQEGREYPLDKQANSLGRDEHADVALFRDMRVEKWHAYIRREGNRYFLVNNHAPPDYTKVNGNVVAKLVELHDGDRVELGQVVLRFQMRLAQAWSRKKVVRGS